MSASDSIKVIGCVALSLIPVLVLSSPAHGSRPSPCTSKGTTTLLATNQARVFLERDRVFACLYRTRGLVLLGTRRSGRYQVGNLRLAGRFVAYSTVGPERTKLSVRELRRGRIVHNAVAAKASRPGFTAVTDVELKRNGSVAWIARTMPYDVQLAPPGSGDPRLDYEVRKFDRDGLRLLDAGHDIQGHSLTRRDRNVYWMRAGATYSAAID